ncbi:general transcription factor IIE subunit 2-like protein [Tanacetum coccineum]
MKTAMTRPVSAIKFSNSNTAIPGVVPPVKFSQETEKWQLINTVRKSPVSAQVKRLIDLLFESRKSLTAEQITKVSYVDVEGNKDMFEFLAKNPKVTFDGKYFSYKPTHIVGGKTQLLSLITGHVDGIAVADLKDAYPTVMQDLQALKAGGQIWLLSSLDYKEGVAYPNLCLAEDKVKVSINVDDGLKQLYRETELPRDMLDVERELRKNGMKPATNMAKRREMAQNCHMLIKPKPRERKKVISKRTKLTNSHLEDLLRALE